MHTSLSYLMLTDVQFISGDSGSCSEFYFINILQEFSFYCKFVHFTLNSSAFQLCPGIPEGWHNVCVVGTLFINIADICCSGTRLPISRSNDVFQYRHFK